MVPVGTITLELTHRCHRRCAFCTVPTLAAPSSTPSHELSADEISRTMRHLISATGCRRVQVSGGEPLLRSDLRAVLEALRGEGTRVSILTDGAHLDASLARDLATLGVEWVQPTLLSGEAPLHDSLRGPHAHRSVTRAIAIAAAAGLRVSVCMVLTRINCEEASRVAELAFALGASGLALSRFCPPAISNATTMALMPSPTQVRDAAQLAARTCRDLGLPLAAAVTIPPCVWDDPDRPLLRTGICSLTGPKSTVTIGPDGTVRSCTLSTEGVGNVLWDSWDVLARRLDERCFAPERSQVIPACEGCAQWQRCHGGCRMAARAAFGAGCHPDPLARVAGAPTNQPTSLLPSSSRTQ